MLVSVLRRQHPGFARLGGRQEGDTIVEVLIAVAIISLILTAAYVITNKNTLAVQGNQERVQARHLAEGQIESLRAQGSLATSGDCFDDTGNEVPGINATCNAVTLSGSGATYVVTVTGPVGPVSGTYTAKVTWTDLATSRPDNVTMYYRLQ